MAWPASQDYNEAIQSPSSSFADPELRAGQPVVNALGMPLPRSGNFADVYEFIGASGSRWAIKCFTREVRGLHERYIEISKHLTQVRLPFTVDFRYLEQGIRIHGQWYPVLKMQWVEGFLLNEFVRRQLERPATLDAMGQIWLRMARRLRGAGMAHADLQHGNILLVPGNKTLSVKLIDYDGMWVPTLANRKSGEVGHPAYQHPQRLQQGTYSAEVDRLPLLAIACALRCLVVGGKPLWARHDNGDNLLFREADLRTPGKSALFQELLELPDPLARLLVQELHKALTRKLEDVPAIDELLPEPELKPASGRIPAAVAVDDLPVAVAVDVPVAMLVQPPPPGPGAREAPPDTTDAYWILRGGKRRGPYSEKRFHDMQRRDEVAPTDQVWLPASQAWLAATDVQELWADVQALSGANKFGYTGPGMVGAFRKWLGTLPGIASAVGVCLVGVLVLVLWLILRSPTSPTNGQQGKQPGAGARFVVETENPPTRFLGLLFDIREANADSPVMYDNFNFGLSLADLADPKQPKATPLIFGARGQTSNTLVRVDGLDTTFGKPGTGQWADARPQFTNWEKSRLQKDGVGTWKVNHVLVTQTVKIVPGQPTEVKPGVLTRHYDTCLVVYKIENRDIFDHHVGMRIVLDTMIGANDGVPFAAPGSPDWITKREFIDIPKWKGREGEVPDFLMAFEKPGLDDPGTVAQLNLRLQRNLEPPSRVLLTRWPAADAAGQAERLARMERWEVPLADIETDSSLAMYWNVIELKTGQTRELGYSYGLGSLAGPQGQPAVAMGGVFAAGGELSIVCLVNHAKPGEKVTLALPAELSLLPGFDATQEVPAPDGDRPRLITWRVRSTQAGIFEFEVKTTAGLAQKKRVIVSSE